MRSLSQAELFDISGGFNAQQCQQDLQQAAFFGGMVGGAFGLLAGGFGAFAGTMVGIAGAGYLVANNDPACQS